MSRLLKFILLLVLVNVAVFLWPSAANVAPHAYRGKAEVNPHFVRLNQEIESRFYADISENVLISEPVDDELVVDFDRGIDIVAAGEAVGGGEGGECYRLGPFAYQESYELAQAVLFNADVQFTKRFRVSKESDVFRLYLGPFSSSAQVAESRLELKQKKILDHFSRKLDDGQYIISLGIYSSQESADSAVRLFSNKLQDVKVQGERVVLPNSYWLHFELLESSNKVAQLTGINWGENSVKMSPYKCLS